MIAKQIKGQLLIAEPSLFGDLTFNRSVVLMADHSQTGSVGFILNKPLHHLISDFVPAIHADFQVYIGGPVDQDSLFFIHNSPEKIQNSQLIANGIYWGGNFNQVCQLINDNEIDDTNIRFFLGYSGWNENQLELEIQTKSWILAKNDVENKILEKAKSDFWTFKMNELGGTYQYWSHAPENPNLN